MGWWWDASPVSEGRPEFRSPLMETSSVILLVLGVLNAHDQKWGETTWHQGSDELCRNEAMAAGGLAEP